jgi:hypothetical protein
MRVSRICASVVAAIVTTFNDVRVEATSWRNFGDVNIFLIYFSVNFRAADFVPILRHFCFPLRFLHAKKSHLVKIEKCCAKSDFLRTESFFALES